jgi:hypothetical protein
MAVMSDRRPHDSWTRDYRLSHCEGYAVHSPEGRVGYVEQVVPPPELGEPVALRVRTEHDGEPALTLIPIDVVREVSPWRERILVEDSSRQFDRTRKETRRGKDQGAVPGKAR